jgi:lipopolysaccharide export LptBFGC system permease protein LptF
MSSSQIQTLSNQFNSILTEYQSTYAEFMNTIKSNDTSLTTVENSAFTGSGTINTNPVSSISDCTTACSSNTSCSGATFTSTNNNCTLSSGSGNIVNATNSTAIVQKGLSYSYQLQNLNQQLMNINEQINTTVNQSNTTYQNNLGQINEQGQALQQNYTVLTGDRDRINIMIREFETLNEAQQNSDINVTMSYYNYIILLFVAIFLVVLLLRFSVPSEQVGGGNRGGNSKYQWLAFFIGIYWGFYYIFKN